MVTFAQEFERTACDTEFDEEGAKELLISNLNLATLFRLDNASFQHSILTLP